MFEAGEFSEITSNVTKLFRIILVYSELTGKLDTVGLVVKSLA